MPEPRSIAWLLSPEELVAACAAVGIIGLPHSRWVGESITHEPFFASVGGRSLNAARLAAMEEGILVVEPRLARALLALTGQGHDAVASFTSPTGVKHVATIVGGGAASMIESPDGVEIIVGDAAEALARLEARSDELLGAARGMAGDVDPRPAGEASIPTQRWDAIVGGRPPRRSDDPLGAAAAQAACGHGIWEGGSLRMTGGGGYVGEVSAWVVDGSGAMTVELGSPDAEGEISMRVTAATDLAGEVRALWQPVREAIAAPLSGRHSAETRRPVSHA